MNIDSLRKSFWDAYDNPHSDFYRLHYGERGFVPEKGFPRHVDDWQRLPLLTKEEIAAVPLQRRTFVPQTAVKFYRLSSGTSNRGTVIVPRTYSPDRRQWLAYTQRYLEFVVPGHLPDVSARRAGLGMLTGDVGDLRASAKLASRFGIDGLSVQPTVLVALLPHLEAEMPLSRIRFIFLWGERISPVKYALITQKFPDALISIDYGLSESCGIGGKSCETMMRARSLLVHPEADKIQWELIDDSGMPAKEEGEIVLTSLWEGNAFPLLRYRTGDLARRVPGICTCAKDTYQTFGRAAYDLATIPGGTITSAALEDALLLYRDHIEDDFELHIDESSGSLVQIELRVRPSAGSHIDLETLARSVAESLRISPNRTLAGASEAGFVAHMKCVLLDSDRSVPKKQLRIFTHY